MYGLGRLAHEALQGHQTQADRLDMLDERENRQARRTVLEGREDDKYAREVSRYGIQDELDQQSVDLGAQNLEKQTRSNDFDESTYGLKLADEEHRLKTASHDRDLGTKGKMLQNQGRALGNSGQALRNQNQSYSNQQKAIQTDLLTALKDGNKQKQVLNLKNDLDQLQYDAAQTNSQEGARLVNENMYNGVDNAHDILTETRDGEEVYNVVDKDGNTVISDDGVPMIRNKAEMDAQFGGKGKDTGKWKNISDTGYLFNEKTGKFKFGFDGKNGAGAGISKEMVQRLKNGTQLLVNAYGGKFDSATGQWSIPESNKDDFMQAVAVYQKEQLGATDRPYGDVANSVFARMRGMPNEQDSRVDPGMFGDKDKAAQDSADNFQGPRDELARQSGILTDIPSAGSAPAASSVAPAPESSAETITEQIAPATLEKLPVDKVVVPRSGPLAGKKIVKRANGQVEIVE